MRTTILFLLLIAAPAFAATPVQKCAGAKLQAFGKGIDARSQCYAAARKKNVAVDPACLAKAETKLREAFAKSEKTVACPNDADTAVASSTSCATQFDGAISGDAACAAAKIKAAGKKAAGKMACAKKHTLKDVAIEACLAKVESKFAKAVAKAESKRTCSGTVDGLEAIVDACLVTLPPPIPCSGGDGSPTCNGACPDGLTCRAYEVFDEGASVDAGCSCVDVVNGPDCSGTTCGTDQHCDDPMHVCERWMNADGCDHMICQPAMTTPTTLPQTDKIIECSGGEFPSCGGTCPDGLRCQTFVGYFGEEALLAGCICVDPVATRCEFQPGCNIALLPFSHCADPGKACVAHLGGTGDDPVCESAHCEDAPNVTTSTSSTSTTSTSTSTSTSITTTSSTLVCASTAATSGKYQDLGDCTVLDTSTGLQWEKKSDDIPGGLHDVTARYPWSGCCDYDCSTAEQHCQPDAASSAACFAHAEGTEGCGQCATGTCRFYDPTVTTTVWGFVARMNAEEFAGHDDWRLAKENGFNIGSLELESILLMPFPCTTDPLACIDPIFGPTAPDLYWSATTKGATGPTRPSDGWWVDFLHGNFGDGGKWGMAAVRAVRDSQ